MGRLTAGQRKSLPKSTFGVPAKAPGSGSYPMPDRSHAIFAKEMAARHASPGERKVIDSKANRIIRGS